jgi:hypothetical protein
MIPPLQLAILIAIFLIVTLIYVETLLPDKVKEGFTSLLTPSSSILTIPPRGDIGESAEESGYQRDERYFHGYADVSRLGVPHDYCRLIAPKEDPDAAFFACALAGTENLDSTTFRTRTTKEKGGLVVSRDDYMKDASKDTGGRASYCRILKYKDGTFQPLCLRANDTGFDTKDIIDLTPPEDIQLLLTFYSGCVSWLRLFDDIEDYTKTVRPLLAGQPAQPEKKGLQLNGTDQFIRLADSNDLELGHRVPLRSVRAFHVWVYFDEFTNNAHIFDFGNGPGRDNVFLGIVGRGDADPASRDIRSPLMCGDAETQTLPIGPSGAQIVPETTPQNLMKTTSANTNDFKCIGFEMKPDPKGHAFLQEDAPSTPAKPTTATLLFEIWDMRTRKLQIKVPGAIPLRKWTHIVVSAASTDAMRPDLAIYVNSVLVAQKPSGYLPSSSFMSRCYLGKSNWVDATNQYDNKDELFRGSLFDFRMYRTPLPPELIQKSYTWGQQKLELV